MLFSNIMSRLLAFIGSTPTPTTSFEPTTLDFDDHSLNNTLISRDRPIGFFGPVRGRQYQLRVNAYRNDKGGCSWPDGIGAYPQKKESAPNPRHSSRS